MFLTSQQTNLLSQIVALLAEPFDEKSVRTQLGELLLRLLRADCYASYVWDDKQRVFVDRIALNMSDDNLGTYEAYYQFHDPITHRLRQCREPTRVTQILAQRELVKTEFFNDFLRRDGLFWGVNLYASVDGENTADMRIWRGRGGEDFNDTDLTLLKMITPAYGAALRRCRQQSWLECPARGSGPTALDDKLTAREAEIVRLAASGLPDKEIARRLRISFTTVRTHLEHAFRKLDVVNRVQLAALVR
ncbi:helix-turn-helix transcriptional regulator [Bordetella sp. FB-8]|uniref:helix-turn-helix transcriptional regulator n=1 Tax=Bordetella sp. FB-8 TaxID=1159870 RepID=UPI0003683D52|nr:helix-turn-helix transcriptional regulator [Bordetella sp. FB-8]